MKINSILSTILERARRGKFPEIENRLTEDILARRRDGAVVTGIYIINKARPIARELNIYDFVGN